MKKLLIAVGAVLLLAGVGLLAAGIAHFGETPAKLTWTAPEFRSALMTFAYKVYGNPKMDDGRHYLSKITFKNAGQRPITDFAISYKLQDYIPWTDPETMPDIPAGFSFAKLYYPRLPADVTKLHSPTTCALEVKVQWKEDGKPRQQTFRHDVLLRSVNELTYCNLPASEVESWFDSFDTSDFAVAMVTPNDPVVAAYAAQITKMAGGTIAGVAGGPKEISRICGVVYDYMCRTGLRYTGDNGVPANFDDVKTLSQAVRLPRDVILNNNGLCIELAILWASILEHLDVNAALVMVPGHCYVIAYSPDQGVPLDDGFPIECTAITPQAVGKDKPVSFLESNKMAVDETKQHMEDGRFQVFPVSTYQQMGFTPPELPEVDITRITDTLEKRLPATAPPTQVAENNAPANPEPSGSDETQQPPPPEQTLPSQPSGNGRVTWQHPQGYLSIDFPANFVSVKPRVNPGNVLLLVAGDPTSSLECDVMHVTGTQNPVAAWQYISRSCARNKIFLKLGTEKNGPQGMVFYAGTSDYHGVLRQWVCAGKPVPNGVVFVSAGTNQLAWKSEFANVENLMNHVHFR
jgi:hypothetical protein